MLRSRAFPVLIVGLVGWMVSMTSAQDGVIVERDATTMNEVSSTVLAGEVIFGHKAGMALTYDVIQPEKNNGAAVIFVVSGGWNSTYRPPQNFRQMRLLDRIHDEGYVLILLRHGSAPRFKVPEAVDDVKLGVRHIRKNAEKLGFNSERLGICGASAGGHLSLMVATTGDDGNPDGSTDIEKSPCRVACVAAYFPPTDLRTMVGPSERFPALDFDKDLAAEVSPLIHVTDDDAPTLLVHGTEDRLVPVRHSELLKKEFDRIEVVPCELLVLQGAGHGFRGHHAEDAELAVLEWFSRFLVEPWKSETND